MFKKTMTTVGNSQTCSRRSLLAAYLLCGACFCVASHAWAQLPSVGGATAGATGGPGIGPNIGPSVGPSISPQLPNAAGQRIPNTSAAPNVAQPLNRAPRNVPADQSQVLPNPTVDRNLSGSVQGGQNSISDLQQDLGMQFTATGNGMRVGNVKAGSLSSRAGFQVGDEILAVERSWVRSPNQFLSQLASAAQTSGRAWVLVNRGGQQAWVNTTINGASRPTLGVLANDQGGIMRIAEVTQGSAAANAGLRAGDQVIAVNGKEIKSFADLTANIRAAAATNGQLDLTISRDGVEQTVHAVLGQANAVAQQANALGQEANAIAQQAGTQANAAAQQVNSAAQGGLARAQQTAANLQKDVESLADAGGEAVRAKLGEVQRETQALRQEVNAVAKEQGEQLVQKLAIVREKVRSVQSQLTSLANQASGDLKARLQQAQNQAVALEQELMDTTQGTAGQVTNRVDSLAGTAGQVAGTAGQRAAQLQERAVLVKDALANLVTGQVGGAENRLQTAIQQAAVLAANVSQFAQNGSQTAIAQARDEASALQARVHDLGSTASGAAQSQLNELEGHIASLRGSLQSMAMAEAGDAARGVANIRAEIVAEAANLENEIQDVAGQANAAANQEVARLQQHANSLREDLASLETGAANAASQRLDNARQKIALIRQEVGNLSQQGSAIALERLDRIQDRAAVLYDRLADLAGPTVNAAKAVVDQTRQNVTNVLDSASQTNVAVDAAQRGRLGLTVRGPAGNLTITGVENGSLAAQAGLQAGDRIKAINGLPVSDPRQLDAAVTARSATSGRTTISYERNGQTHTTTIGAPAATVDTAKLGAAQ